VKVFLLSYGFPEVCAPLATSLAPHADVVLAMPSSQLSDVRATIPAAVVVEELPAPRLRDAVGHLRLMRYVTRLIRRHRPDVVHLQQGHLWFNFALSSIDEPLVISVHDATLHPGDLRSRATPFFQYYRGFRAADALIVHSESVKRQLVARDLDPAAIVSTPLPGGTVVESPTPPCGERVLFFGRIWPYKGLQYLIAAEPLIAQRVGRFTIVIAGTGESVDAYQSLMSDASRYEIHNEYISEAKRDDLFRRSAVVVLPYVEASQSGVVLLAFAHGRPVVASRVGGLPEVVDDGVDGYLVPPGDPVALADAITRVLSDEAVRRRMGEAAARKFAAEWSSDAIAHGTIAAYRLAVARAGHR
jgi:glycosyltransferase involved in cell wall biosynthesis